MLDIDVLFLLHDALEVPHELWLGSREVVADLAVQALGLDEQRVLRLFSLLAKKQELSVQEFEKQGIAIVGAPLFPLFLECMAVTSLDELCTKLPLIFSVNASVQTINELLFKLGEGGVEDVVFDPNFVGASENFLDVYFEFREKFSTNPPIFLGGRIQKSFDRYEIQLQTS